MSKTLDNLANPVWIIITFPNSRGRVSNTIKKKENNMPKKTVAVAKKTVKKPVATKKPVKKTGKK